jgi:hypothetical protein
MKRSTCGIPVHSQSPMRDRARLAAIADFVLLAAMILLPASVCASEPRPLDPTALREDWKLQDELTFVAGRIPAETLRRVFDELGNSSEDLRARNARLIEDHVQDESEWLALYHDACRRRRQARLQPYLQQISRLVFTKHYNLGGSHYAYTEDLTDSQHVERSAINSDYRMGAALCSLEVHADGSTVERTLLDAPTGVIRDPDVSYDGKRILFSMRRSNAHDDFHLWELNVETNHARQLTFGKGVADYEGQYLPSGELVFNSTRPVQTVDCFWTEVSNLYTCNGNGENMRRLCYDQVHTNFPTVTPDGRILYTRWDYSDRGQVFPQGLFQMHPDGTGQGEFYGNNSWFPTTILHARAVPNTNKVMAIFTGHHSHQRGKLGILDRSQGNQENWGAQLIAPVRDTPAERVDAYGQDGPQFQYPYPLDEKAFLVTMDPIGSPARSYRRPYAVYWMDQDGRRELLAWDPHISCNQPIPLRARPRPFQRSNIVDRTNDHGTYVIQDIYNGQGLTGVRRGTIRNLRVVAIEFRAAGIRCNYSRGPAGAALSSTPVSIGNGSWDPKIILGDATVYEDGSACFNVPAHTPVYFQALDANGRAVQTMRSWSTLQSGETQACVGCHEAKNTAPRLAHIPLALLHGPQTLKPFYGNARGFSFAAEIQPILDKHCIRCHRDRQQDIAWNRNLDDPLPDENIAFSLLSEETVEQQSGRRWSDSYLRLTGAHHNDIGGGLRSMQGQPNRLVHWISVQSEPSMLAPYSNGAVRSGLLRMLEEGHAGVQLDREAFDKLAAWMDLLVPYCGDYVEANAWTDEEQQKYQHFSQKRKRLATN